ncbi:hypothetical protein ABIA33_004055 [Streptacidiphilus sp. MAP12-16]
MFTALRTVRTALVAICIAGAALLVGAGAASADSVWASNSNSLSVHSTPAP